MTSQTKRRQIETKEETAARDAAQREFENEVLRTEAAERSKAKGR